MREDFPPGRPGVAGYVGRALHSAEDVASHGAEEDRALRLVVEQTTEGVYVSE